MAKTRRPYVPEEDLRLPPSLRDWLPADHLMYFVSDVVDALDLSAITAVSYLRGSRKGHDRSEGSEQLVHRGIILPLTIRRLN